MKTISKESFKRIGNFSIIVLIVFNFTLFVFPTIAMAIEEPNFTLLENEQAYEIRAYAPKIIAEVEVDAEMREASSIGFRLIADFIFGNNLAQSGKSEKISMTAPVAIKPSFEKISMTAPVGLQQSNKGWRVYFVMPSQYTLETLPKPNNPRIIIKVIPSQKFAVLRFSGLVNEEK